MHVSVPCTSTASPHRTGDGSGVAGAGVAACGAGTAVACGGLADGDANPAVGSGATVVVEPPAQPASPTTAATANASMRVGAFARMCSLHRDAACVRWQIRRRP